MRTFLFYCLSALTLLSAISVVTLRSLFRAAMGLIGMLLGVAGLYLLVDAQFLSAAQITVYVGGIVVLIVYVVLLVGHAAQHSEAPRQRWRQGVAGVVAAALFTLLAVAMVTFDWTPAQASPPRSAPIATIGEALLSPRAGGFVLPFEIISLVLIAAIIGAITLARPGHFEEKEEGR